MSLDNTYTGINPDLYRKVTLPALNCTELARDAVQFMIENCTEDRILSRWAYPPDRGTATLSFCVAVKIPGSPEVDLLPGFSASDMPSSLVSVSLEIASILGLSKGRMMMNMNFYHGGSDGIMRHFDGDWLDFSMDGESLNVRLGVRPLEVAILTLLNRNACGGTVLFDSDNNSSIIKARAGEVICFDNVLLEHAASPLDDSCGGTGLGRCVLSWRSIDEKCCLVRDNTTETASFEEVIECHRQIADTPG